MKETIKKAKDAEGRQPKKKLDSLAVRKARNPKAFAINAPKSAERRFRRKQDLQEKKFHQPLPDRTPLEPPPVIVAVVGPPKVGKSTLIKSLVKYFTKHGLSSARGPITVVSGKKRRVTFIECNNDIHSMLDIAKVADLVLLMVDASFGFEMELFEFLNICQSHGFPKIMAILTHLDLIKSIADQKKVKKNMKKRFWTEIYKGAKLFFIYGLSQGDLYNKRDTQKIAQQVTVMKFRPLSWQTSHPYVLVDRIEDLTDPERVRQDRDIDRHVSMYGYVRGNPLTARSEVHIPGCGDFKIKEVSSIPDPCPLPQRGDRKKGRINEKERLIYAPFCGVGGILCDKDAVYIEVGGSHSFTSRLATQESDNLVGKILESKHTIDDKMRRSEFRFFKDEVSATDDKFVYDDDDDDDGEEEEDGDEDDAQYHDESDDNLDNYTTVQRKKHNQVERLLPPCSMLPKYHFDDNPNRKTNHALDHIMPQHLEALGDEEDEGLDDLDDDELAELASIEGDDDDDEDMNGDEDQDFENELRVDKSELQWKRNLSEKAEMNFYRRQNDTRDIQQLVYGGHSGYKNIHSGLSFSFDDDPDDNVMRPTENSIERTIERCKPIDENNYEVLVASIKNKFVTGKWDKDKDAFELLNSGSEMEECDDELDDDEEAFDDFEDLENGKVYTQSEQKKVMFSEVQYDGDDALDQGDDIDNDNNDDDDAEAAKRRMMKKIRSKAAFDSQYDSGQHEDQLTEEKTFFETQKEKLSEQAEKNRAAFQGLGEDVRLQVEGHRPGLYVRLEMERIPSKLVDLFDPSYPLILGGLNAGELGEGFVRVRIKKHRWFKRILKTRDPLIISMGWRRFQTSPIYHVMDDNMRNRALKYTPWHLHCMATFWAPLAPQGTGLVALQQTDEFTQDFRIAATGVIMELDKSADIVKKLKLVGVPMEVFTKTAFIKNMFTSSLEVAKFENTPIKTVSGIRGMIKKAIKNPDGAFRATFEDKILMSDIVFLRTWYHVDVPKFCITVKTLLMPADERDKWRGARTTGQIRFETGAKATNSTNPDSIYKPVARKQFNFRPFTIPKQLQKELPYKDKPKFTPKQDDGILRIRPEKSAEEKRRLEALMMMSTLQKDRMLKSIEKRFVVKEKKEKMMMLKEKRKRAMR